MVILRVIMMANDPKCAIPVAPKWSPKWSRKSTNCDKKQREEDCCKKIEKRSNSWPLDWSSEGFPPVREPYFHFYRNVQQILQKGTQNELFWTTLVPAGLLNAVCFANQKLSISNKQMRGSLPPLPPPCETAVILQIWVPNLKANPFVEAFTEIFGQKLPFSKT